MLRRYRLLAPDMGSNPTGGEPQAGGPAASTSAPGGQTTPSEPQAGDEQISLDEAKKLRSEAASLRKRMKVLEDEKAAAEAAKLPEKEQLQKQLADTQAQLSEKERANQERVIRYEVQLQAAALGVDPLYLDKIARLIDRKEIKTDDEGAPTNVKELLDKLVKEMPALLLQQQGQRPSTAGGATNPGRAATNASQITADFVQKLTSGQLPADTYEKLSQAQKNEVQRVMRNTGGRKWY